MDRLGNDRLFHEGSGTIRQSRDHRRVHLLLLHNGCSASDDILEKREDDTSTARGAHHWFIRGGGSLHGCLLHE